MGKCNFNPTWLLKDDSNGCKVAMWAKKHDEQTIFCNVCQCTVIISKGFQAITQHASTGKHKQQFDLKLNPSQLHISNGSDKADSTTDKNFIPGPVSLTSIKDEATKAELLWTLKTVAANYSALSCSGIVDLFKSMFPNVPDGFCLNPKKVHYLITDALAPYFQKRIIEDVKNVYYSLMFDETTNSCNKKELQIMLRYWSNAQNKVISQHLETFFLGSATAEIIFSKICEALDNVKLSRDYLLMLGNDGPNVNKKVHKLMNDDLKVSCNRSLVDVGSCNIHSVHNAYLKALSELGESAVELITALHYFFYEWPSRWEDFTAIQSKLDIPNNKFIKHCPSRWLTVEPACKRVLEQWPAVVKYFLKHVPTKNLQVGKTRTYKSIYFLLKKTTIKAELYFVMSSANIFIRFTGLFQKDEPLVHILHSELSSLLQTLMNRFCTKSYIKTNSFDSDNILKEANHVPLKDIVCCDDSLKELNSLSDSDQHIFLKAAKQHYLAACVHLIKKTSLSSNLLKKLKCLHPNERSSKESCKDIVGVSKALQMDVPSDQLQDEWKALQLEKYEDSHNKRIDVYWRELLDKKNSFDKCKYPLISKVVKAALVLSHGNAEVERGFSESGRALTDEKSSMSERTLNSIMLVKSFLKLYNNKPELVPVTKELISYGRSAHKNYESYLNEQKRLQEIEDKKKKQDDEDKRIEEEKRKMILEEKKTIKECEEVLKEKRRNETKGK